MNSKSKWILFAVLISLISVVVIVLRSVKANYRTIIMDAQIRDKDDNYYTDCYFKWNGNNYLITDYYEYKNDDLVKYKSASTAGFIIRNLTDSAAFYGGNRDRYKKLWYKQSSDHLQLDNEKLKIDYLNKDTIVSKLDSTFIKVIIHTFLD